MTDAEWRGLIAEFVDGRICASVFHDRFLDGWRSTEPRVFPDQIEMLFFTVEAYCPDPALRNPSSPFEAEEAELLRDARSALQVFDAPRSA